MPHSADKKDVPLGLECAAALELAAGKVGMADDLSRAPAMFRECIAASMFANCVEHVANQWASRHAEHKDPTVEREHLLADRLKWLSTHYAESRCKDVKVPDDWWQDMGDVEREAASLMTNTTTRRLH